MNNQFANLESVDAEQLSLKKTLDIVCGKWRLLIVYQIGTEARRYGELRRMIPEVSEKVLVQELKSLVELGMIEKKIYGEVPPRVEYSLTTKALKILPTLIKLTAIGEIFLEP